MKRIAPVLVMILGRAGLMAALSCGLPRPFLAARTYPQLGAREGRPRPRIRGGRGNDASGRVAFKWKLFGERGPGRRGLGRGRKMTNGSLGASSGPLPAAAAASALGRGNSTLAATQGYEPQLLAHEGAPLTQASIEEDTPSLERCARGGSRVQARTKQNILRTLWQFSRPHTMIGTAIAIPTMGIFASPPGAWPTRRFLLAMLWAMIPSLLINVYITGLNQVTDVEIDRVNKPYLPIPAGNLSLPAAKATIVACLVAGSVLGFMPSSFGSAALALTVGLSVLIGTGYSLPPLRLKRFPQVAALCILVVRGSIINGGFYTHAQAAAYGIASENTAMRAMTLPLRDAKCALALAYFTIFAIVIALMKDVPDVAGDRKFNIRSFSVVLGEGTLFRFARRLLTVLLWSISLVLGFAARTAAKEALPWIAVPRGVVAACSAASAELVRRRARSVDPKQPGQVYSFYMFLWKIFYASYMLLPLAR